MKVMHVNTVCGTGSTGRIALDIHNMLLDYNHESVIAYGRGDGGGCKESIRITSPLNVYFHVMNTRIFDNHGFSSTGSTIRFVEYIKKNRPDVIHLHNIHGYYVNVAILFTAIKELNIPIVWTLHDCWSFTGHCAYFDYIACDKWQTECYSCPQKSVYPKSLLVDNSKKNYIGKRTAFSDVNNLTIVTPSRWLERLVKSSYLRNYKTSVIHNGIDLDLFYPRSSNFKEVHGIEDKFVILGVASVWERRKGLDFFLEMNEVLRDDEVIVLVGLTDKQAKKLPPDIVGITRTNNVKELVEIYSSADVFVNPTLEDNFPTTNLEAIACGVPVVTFNTGGSSESISQATGHVIEDKNVYALYEGVSLVRDNGSHTYRSKCLEYAKNNFSKTEKFKRYIDLYEDIISIQSQENMIEI